MIGRTFANIVTFSTFIFSAASAQESGVLQEFRQACLASGGDLDQATENAVNAGFSLVSGELGEALGFKKGIHKRVFLKSNPYGQGSLVLSFALIEFEGQDFAGCSLLASHEFNAMKAEVTDFFGTPAKVSFMNNGIRTAVWDTLVNGESSDVFLRDMGSGEPVTQLSVMAPTDMTAK